MGRPLSFDRGIALQRAMIAFWRHGYETTSVADLTAAMGITAPSLYAAFGDKRGLFLEAVALYAVDPSDLERAMESAASARDAAAQLLDRSVAAFTGADTPPGCLLASAGATGSADSADVRRVVTDVRNGIRAMLRRRIARDVAEGRLPREADPAALADLVVAVVQGMSVLARDGASRPVLAATAAMALRAWPAPPRGDA